MSSQDEAEANLEAVEQNVIGSREEALQVELADFFQKHRDLEKSAARINAVLQENHIIQNYSGLENNDLQSRSSLENELESQNIIPPEQSSREPDADPCHTAHLVSEWQDNPDSPLQVEDPHQNEFEQNDMTLEFQEDDSDTFQMMMLHSPTVGVRCFGCNVHFQFLSKPWLLGIFVFALQMILGTMIVIDQGAFPGLSRIEGQTFANLPIRVKPSVSAAQLITLILCPFVQPEWMVAIKTLLILRPACGETHWKEIINETGASNDISLWIWRIFFPNMLKLLEGAFITYTSWIVIFQSEDVLSLLIDFTALFIISSIDDIFCTVASYRYMGKDLAEIAIKSKNTNIGMRNGKVKKFYCLRMTILVTYILLGFIGWSLILNWQHDGTIAKQKYPSCTGVDFSRIGNFICDYDEPNFNTKECGWDGGDCVVNAFPGCHVIPSNLGNGVCDGGNYNRENCGYDGGDCVVENYRKCRVDQPEKISDGTCDGGDYNVESCGWDGGDCNIFLVKYPTCQVPEPKRIGDGECDGEPYDTVVCGWDGGDCEKKTI